MSDMGENDTGQGRISEAERQARARRERAARTLRDNLARRKQQGRARRAGDADEASGLPAARHKGEPSPSDPPVLKDPAANSDESPE